MKKTISKLWVLGALAASATVAEDDVSDSLRARGEQQLQSFVTEVQTLAGDFRQTVYGADGQVDDEYEGDLQIARPGRFFWRYTSPYEQQLVADGVNLWNYDVDLDQISVTAQEEALGQSPAAVLSGTNDVLERVELQGAFEADGQLWVQMALDDNEGDFSGLRFGFDLENNQLSGMQITDSLGQLTIIEFDNVSVNEPIDPKVFEFSPPDGVDVIGEPVSPTSDAASEPQDSQLPVAGLG